MPDDVFALCEGKSTYGRIGLIANILPIEPGWSGYLTMCLVNPTSFPMRIYANEGAFQFLFLQGDEPCEVSYRDKAGKYQGQRGVTLPKI